MTVREICYQAAQLLGFFYFEPNEYPFTETDFTLFNRAFYDLSGKIAEGRESELSISEELLDAVIYGTAMFMALNLCETDKYNMLSHLYSAKRRKYLSGLSAVKDVMP